VIADKITYLWLGSVCIGTCSKCSSWALPYTSNAAAAQDHLGVYINVARVCHGIEVDLERVHEFVKRPVS